jgi:hypothetical protein
LSVSFLDLRSFTVQFVTYEVDYGGFNNVRMTLETLLVFAKATGRTIVLPPKSPIYLLKPKQNSTTTAAGKTALEKGKGGAKKAAPLVSAVDYFREGIEALQRDNVLDVITFQEFVQSESQAPGGVVFDAALRIQAALQVDPAWGVTNSRGNADGVSPKRTKTKETAAAASGLVQNLQTCAIYCLLGTLQLNRCTKNCKFASLYTRGYILLPAQQRCCCSVISSRSSFLDMKKLVLQIVCTAKNKSIFGLSCFVCFNFAFLYVTGR